MGTNHKKGEDEEIGKKTEDLVRKKLIMQAAMVRSGEVGSNCKGKKANIT